MHSDLTFISMQYENDILLRLLQGKEVERPPIWIMRQAGRILPEYREIRASLSGFKALVSNPDLASTVTVQPVDALGVDAAIIFSDILVIPEAMGLDYELIEKKGPFFHKTIETREDVEKLLQGKQAADNLSYVYEAVAKTVEKLEKRVPLIGFAGAPWTLMCYMVEGSGSKTFFKTKSFLYAHPELSHALLDKLTQTIIAYLKKKISFGLEVVQVFDSWAGVLDKEMYSTFCIPYLKRIREAITEVPVILFSKGAWFSMDDIIDIKPNVVGLDWTLDPKEMRKQYGTDQIFQGNMDPTVLFASKEVISKKVEQTISSFGSNHIFNLGHGVYPLTPLENVKHFVSAVKSFRY